MRATPPTFADDSRLPPKQRPPNSQLYDSANFDSAIAHSVVRATTSYLQHMGCECSVNWSFDSLHTDSSLSTDSLLLHNDSFAASYYMDFDSDSAVSDFDFNSAAIFDFDSAASVNVASTNYSSAAGALHVLGGHLDVVVVDLVESLTFVEK